MRPNRTLAGGLALLSIVAAVIGDVLALAHVAGWLGLALLGGAAPIAVAAWLALGAPVRRRDLTA